MNKKTVMVVFGGATPEYEVCCNSAASVVKNIDKDKYNVVKVGITREGNWFYTEATPEEIQDSLTWINSSTNKKATLSVSREDHGLIVFEDDGPKTIYVDIVFPVIHGENGEDGTLQGAFEIAGIPYVGSGVCSSSCSMDKAVTRVFADSVALTQPGCYLIESEAFKKDMNAAYDAAEAYHGGKYPVVVKPSMTGSSIGVAVVNNREEMEEAMEFASRFRGTVMVEEFIKGKEIKVAVIGTKDVKTGDLCEIKVEDGTFNDFDLKYKGTGTHKQIPADFDDEMTGRIKEEAIKIYKALNCEDFSRVDFFVTDDNKIYFNEINTIPGFSEKSIFSLMLNSTGMSYKEIVEHLLNRDN